ncbi:MAG: hypothetical protein QM689_09205 [Oscillospiraceae bacterium]
MTGQETKAFILTSGVKLWQVAAEWGIADSNFSRRLRKPFNEQETERIYAIVEKLKAQKETA